ncbi:MAG: deoxyguanosinetriphosphate triphosphohydrolase [Sphingomonadales bacterium]|jgi:dGTPase
MNNNKQIAAFASNPNTSRGRLVREEESPTRSPFQRDRDRIIHSTAFRRLKHKTQVFVYHEGDHYRTRLTHSIEVSQIARSICRVLGLNEDLAETLALAHDLGHTAFGHAGEDALDACIADEGGFDHNAQALRIVTKLEHKYALFDGLNLTWESLEGLVKHNGPLLPLKDGEALPVAITNYVAAHDLELDTYASAEAQVAALADDIAYNNHDIDDGIRAGLFDLEDLRQVPLVDEVLTSVEKKYPGLAQPRLVHEVTRRLISLMVEDVIAETRRRLDEYRPQSVEDVRHMPCALVEFSDDMRQSDRELKQFLRRRMYRHYKVTQMTDEAKRIIAALYQAYVDDPTRMTGDWARLGGEGKSASKRAIADYIAGMTDSFAIKQYQELIGKTSLAL